MFTDPITLVGDSASTRNYALKSIVDGKTVRANAAAPVNLPELLTISHSVSSRNGVPLDRHSIRLDLCKANALLTVLQASYYVVIEVPQDSTITAAMIKDMRTQMTNFVTDANIAKILNGEP
jgi:hypothetical protein